MNILMLTPDYPPNAYSGIGVHVFHLARNLALEGIKITILVIRTHLVISDKFIDEVQDNFRVIQFQEDNTVQVKFSKIERLVYNNLKVISCIDKLHLTDKDRFDVVHLHEIYPCMVYDHIINKFHLPSVVTIHAMTAASSTMLDALRRYLRITPDIVITVSNALKVGCITRYGMEQNYPEIKVIPNGITLNNNFQHIEKEEILLFCGRLVKMKGCDILIKAFANLIKNEICSNYFLYIVGEGDEKNNLQNLTKELGISSQVIFYGYLDNNEARKYMRRAKALVMPSTHEGFPITALEAMAEGTCVIATNVGGLPELIQNEYNGLIIPPNNQLKLKEKLEFLLKSKELCVELSANAYKTIQKYQWSHIAKQTYNVYKDAINRVH